LKKNAALVIEMENKVNDLQAKINQLSSSSDAETMLYQNEPNPTPNKTIIRYAINKAFMSATIEIYDDKAQLITLYKLPQKQGQGSIEFNGANLQKGVYSYLLRVDGEIMNNKKLLLSY
jgi:hypothetical protein